MKVPGCTFSIFCMVHVSISCSKIVHLIFRNLTVKSVRQQFLEHLGLEKLDSDQKEVFKNIVHDIYTLYSNKHQEHNGHQGNFEFV